jgi:hypothetical protein
MSMIAEEAGLPLPAADASGEELLRMALLYSTGQGGAPLDYVSAHMLFNLAAMRGSEEAKSYRRELSQEMARTTSPRPSAPHAPGSTRRKNRRPACPGGPRSSGDPAGGKGSTRMHAFQFRFKAARSRGGAVLGWRIGLAGHEPSRRYRVTLRWTVSSSGGLHLAPEKWIPKRRTAARQRRPPSRSSSVSGRFGSR